MTVLLSNRLSVRLSVRMEQRGYHWTGFNEILYLGIFEIGSGNFKIY